MKRLSLKFEDPEEMAQGMPSLATNFEVVPDAPGPFKAQLTGLRLGSLAMFEIDMTASRVKSHDQLGYFAIGQTLRVPYQARVNGRLEKFTRNEASAVSPEDRFDLRLPKNALHFALNVFREDLDDYAIAMGGGTGDEPVRIPGSLPLRSPAGLAFRKYLSFLWSEIQSESPLLDSPMVIEETEKVLITSLLLVADAPRDCAGGTVPPVYLRRAINFIMANLSEPLSVGRIAAAAGVHAKRLQRACGEHHGLSLMDFVRQRRLEQVNKQLLAADPAVVTVTDVALANGFSHLSRFSAMYRHQFGELPRETIRRW